MIAHRLTTTQHAVTIIEEKTRDELLTSHRGKAYRLLSYNSKNKRTPDAAPPVAASTYNGTASEQTAEPPTALVPVQQQAVSHPPVPVIKVENIKKTYYMGDTKVHARRGVSLEAQRGEFVAIMGPSGSGKTTFMNLPGCLDRPTRGTYTLAGRLVSDLSADELAVIRNQLIGFVFQGFNLLTRATALKNVMLPLMYAGYAREEKKDKGGLFMVKTLRTNYGCSRKSQRYGNKKG